MFCPKCGSKAADDSDFCSKCGVSLKKKTVPAPVAQARNSPEKLKGKNALAKYFEFAKELELERYTLQETLAKLKYKISTLGISKNFEKIDAAGDIYIDAISGAWLLGIVGGIIALIVLTVKMQKNGESFLWNLIMELGIVKVPFEALLIALLCAAVGALVGCIIGCVIAVREHRWQKEAMEEDDERVLAEMEQIEQLHKQEKQIKNKIAQIENTLSRFYNLGVIFPKYRNLVAVVTMHEYLMSGRCSQLTGPYGAYNLYESESRQNKIICDLGQIKSMLADIRDMQHAMYEAVQESNYIAGQIYSQNESLLASNKKIEENSKIAAYNSKIAATNSKISAYIDTFTYYS